MNDQILRKLVNRLASHPDFLARSMMHYATQTETTLDHLATELGIEVEQIYRLALCRRPRAEQFDQDVRAIASYLALSTDQLVAFIHRIDI